MIAGLDNFVHPAIFFFYFIQDPYIMTNWIRAAAIGVIVASSAGSLASAGAPPTITVGCSTYIIGSISSSYNDSISDIQSQPWWGNPTLARTLRMPITLNLILRLMGQFIIYFLTLIGQKITTSIVLFTLQTEL